MTDRAKLEQMLQYLINEEKDKAEELFHELVVAKSREIYENLLDDDINVEEDSDEEVDESSDDDLDEDSDEEVDESSDDDLDESSDDEEVDESSDEEVDEMFGMQEIGGDPADDMMSDIEGGDDMGGMDDMGDEGGDEPATKDDVMDIKDALDDLKAEFEAMLAGEADDDMDDEEGDMDDMDDEEGDEESDEEEGGNPFAKESVREYTEKRTASMGDNGANTKSIVAGKNDMGGTTANIAKSFSTEKGGTQGGLANPSTKDMNTGNVNKVGGTNAKAFYSKNSKGHGTEKKGSGDNGANTKSLIGGKK
jgi:hypothetical protein